VGLSGLYVLGLCRTIYVGDSGELVAAVHILGIPHPSGYPLYVLLGKLWTLLVPIGSIALRMSLFSAVTASLAATGTFLVARRLELERSAAICAALLLGLSPSFWSQANIQRVYSLNALLMVAALNAAILWWQRRDDRWLIVAVFISALGASNHTYMGIFTIAVALWSIVVDRSLWRRPRAWLACIAAGLVGLLPYLYQPLRSRSDPRLDWGNPESIDSWLAVVTRREAWNRAWIEMPGDVLIIASDYLGGIGVEFYWAGAGLAVIGLAAARARSWPVLLLCLAMLGNFVAMALHGSRSDLFFWHRYYIPTYVVIALLAGLGIQVLGERWRKTVPLVFILPLTMLLVGYPKFDRSRYRVADDFSRSLLAELPPGAHLSASDDNILFVLIYLHLVEGLRPDINLILQGVGQAELQPLAFNPSSEPLYFTHHPNWSVPELIVDPVGLTFKIETPEAAHEEVSITKWELEGENDPRVPKDYLTQNLIGHFHYMLGITLERRDWLMAELQFERARLAASLNDVLFYNLGLIYARNGLYERALESFERSHAINPRHIATRREVRAAEKAVETRMELARIRTAERSLSAELNQSGLSPGTASYHRELARALHRIGESLAAQGHLLIAAEIEGADPGAPS
jgi:tetratricopeptide (TPR) repeat protein